MCTTIAIKNNNINYMCKSMDFFEKYSYSFVYFPKGIIYEEDIFGNNLKSKYSMMGTTFRGYDQFVDGINEHGLMGSTNSFKNEVSFENGIDLQYLNLTSTKIVNVILANCKNVEEVVEMSKKIRLFKRSLVNKNNFSRHYHYMFSDITGKCIVIEFTDGKLEVYNNKYKVMTNTPKFPKHMANVESFIQKDNIEKQKFLSKKLISPTGRFIKAYNELESINDKKIFDLNLFEFLDCFSVRKSDFQNISNFENTTITIYQSILNSKDKSYEFKYFHSDNKVNFNFESLNHIKNKFIFELKK